MQLKDNCNEWRNGVISKDEEHKERSQLRQDSKDSQSKYAFTEEYPTWNSDQIADWIVSLDDNQYAAYGKDQDLM